MFVQNIIGSKDISLVKKCFDIKIFRSTNFVCKNTRRKLSEQILPGQMTVGQLCPVEDGPRYLPFMFGINHVRNKLDIADIEFCWVDWWMNDVQSHFRKVELGF